MTNCKRPAMLVAVKVISEFCLVGEFLPTRWWACWPMVHDVVLGVEAGDAHWCVGYSSRAQRRYRRAEDGSLQAIPDHMTQVLGIRTPPFPRSS